MRRLSACALLALMVAGLMLPALLAPPMGYDSFWIDRTWSEQFTALLRQGNPYPRWLPGSYGGLGAPVFYFYAPASFYLAGLFGLAGLATYPALLAAFAAAWLGSGLAMLAWLAGRAREPVVGALLYMVLPYHVIDFYGRGALAEFCAMALLPLVALGTVHAVERGRACPLMLAYAALIVTHLPTALLAGILLVVPLALHEARGRLLALRPVALGVAGAIGLAAPYLAPALTLQHHTSIASLWSVPFLQPASWSLLHPHASLSRSYVLLFSGLALVLGGRLSCSEKGSRASGSGTRSRSGRSSPGWCRASGRCRHCGPCSFPGGRWPSPNSGSPRSSRGGTGHRHGRRRS